MENEIRAYLRTLEPHVAERPAALLLAEAADEILRLQTVEAAIVLVLGGVAGRKFLHSRLQETFQMQGRYDGAMSKNCKSSYVAEHAAVGGLIERLDEAAADAARGE